MSIDFHGLTLIPEKVIPQAINEYSEGELTKKRIHQEQRVKQNSENTELNAILWTLSPNCTYNEWFRIASAFKYEGGTYEVFKEWSEQYPDFDEAECKRVWNGAGAEDKVPITKGTLLYYSKENVPIMKVQQYSEPESSH